MSPSVIEPARTTPVAEDVDLVVLGGGPAGIAAAVTAGRAGLRVALVERYGFCGGMGTAAGVTNFCGLYASVHGTMQRVVRGIADPILARLQALDGLRETHSVFGRTLAQAYDSAAYKLVLDELLAKAGVVVYLHALAVGATVERERVRAIFIETKSGRFALTGRLFVDASGDGDLALWAGASLEFGDQTGRVSYPSLMFRVGGVDTPRALAEGKPRLRELLASGASGAYVFPRKAIYFNPQPHDGEWRVNATQLVRDGRPLDGSSYDDLRFGEPFGRRQAWEFFEFLRATIPGFERAYVLDFPPQFGIRETRRVRGTYMLTADDILSARTFDDAIGVNGWPIERHIDGDVTWQWIEGRGYHQIPYRCVVVSGFRNLMVAGRCASFTADAQGSMRVSGPCFVMGQACGHASAEARARGDDDVTAIDVARLKARLVADGVFMGGDL